MVIPHLQQLSQKVKRLEAREEPFESLRNLCYILGFISIFMGALSLSLEYPKVANPNSPNIGPEWHLHPIPFPIWEIVFVGGGILLLLSTYFIKKMFLAHTCMSVAWLASGAVWVAYGIMFRPDYVFAFGVISLFMSAQHTILARLWRVSEVE